MKVVDTPPGTFTPATTTGGDLAPIPFLEAVRRFAACGSLARVAEELSVPIYELKKLSRTEIWGRELAELQRAEAAQLNVTLTRLFDATLSGLSDRLENGDIQVIGGITKRVPLSANTLARVAEVVFDKRQLVRQLPTSIIETDNRKLEGLAQRLRALGARDITLLDVDVESIEKAALPSQESALRETA